MKIELTINGRKHTVDVDGSRGLLSVLRDDLALSGTKYGCGEGQCGACTVLLGDQPVHSCTTPVSFAASKPITTIEGLEHEGRLHPVQEAFMEEEAMQCGYCTTGMIMAAVGLLRVTPNPDERRIREAMQGNVCRCGTYPRIVAAIRRAAGPQTPSPEGRP